MRQISANRVSRSRARDRLVDFAEHPVEPADALERGDAGFHRRAEVVVGAGQPAKLVIAAHVQAGAIIARRQTRAVRAQAPELAAQPVSGETEREHRQYGGDQAAQQAVAQHARAGLGEIGQIGAIAQVAVQVIANP